MTLGKRGAFFQVIDGRIEPAVCIKGYDEDRTEVKRLQTLLDKATAELERLKAELKKQYQKARELLDLKNQTRLMKTVLKIPQEYDYKGVLSELNKQGYDFSGKKHKR